MAVTCFFSGRLGNIFFHIAHMIAYAKKYDLTYYVPEVAIACALGKPTITVPSTSPPLLKPRQYREPYDRGHPYYHEIPAMDNILFEGYYQSFKYFDWCRDYIIETFNLPYQIEQGMTSISVRRGDCVGVFAFPIAPLEYYQNAVKFMQAKGHNKFRLYSDDIAWCKENFTIENFPEAEIEFSEGKTELQDYISLHNCENQITARSTFSLTGAWMNQNPNKIVLCPTTRHRYWNSQNLDLIPDYFTQIDFENPC
jgi:hypothetical protein